MKIFLSTVESVLGLEYNDSKVNFSLRWQKSADSQGQTTEIDENLQ